MNYLYKKRVIIIIFLVSILFINIILNNFVKAEEFAETRIDILCSDEIKPGQVVAVKFKMSNVYDYIDAISATLEYDKDVFEELTEDDLVSESKWGAPLFFKGNNCIKIYKGIATKKDEIFLTINFTVKSDAIATTSLIKLTDIDVAGKGFSVEFVESSEFVVGETITPENSEELGVLYLYSDVYKIGNDDITKYQIGDGYISRIQKEIIKEDFINQIETNGNLKIFKENNIELQDNEFIGTGMILQSLFTDDRDLNIEEDLTGIFQKIDDELIQIKIAVSGDLDGDGKVTATDLSSLNQTLLELITLEDEYKIAADFDENGEITATDYSTLNKMVLGIL